MQPGVLALVALTLAAAFASLTVPAGLVFFASRVRNPA